ncbi:serine/threonine-protein kinase mos [Hydra vulgaris]|uniref:non-specific serine/threonine protein kinase n=1 Tax=Hydra vulgaris TaxID=6087 RepID=T2MHH6_HYDVU|nr:serine/threonine-protein kinase mos [Hydra vulgaris]
MRCTCSIRRSYRNLNTSRGSIPDEVNCSFTKESNENLFNGEKSIRLEVGKYLGSGGFGEVFEGRCFGRKIALKRFHKNLKNPHAVSESFQAERAVMTLSHRNVVRILATTNQSIELKRDRLVLMEFAGKNNLLTIINDDKENITPFLRMRFASDIACALNYIHKQNIAHLDVKPANIMVTYKNTCKLGDFGCSKVLAENGQSSPTTPTNSYLTGTLAYRSPELLKGEFPTCKADMYSYGICLWQLLTREKPYGNENMYVVIFGVVSYHLRPDITEKMECENSAYLQLVKSLWRADPLERPSAKEVIVKLRNLRTCQSPCLTNQIKARWRV